MPVTKKEAIIEQIVDCLKLNVYLDGHVFWKRLHKGLRKLNKYQPTALNMLIFCKRESKKD